MAENFAGSGDFHVTFGNNDRLFQYLFLVEGRYITAGGYA
jgi:hypothetical protein